MQSWPLRLPAMLLLSKHVPECEDFGEFGDNQEPCRSTEATVFALIREFNQVRVESSDGRQYAITAKTLGVDFDKLQVGQSLRLTVDQRGRVLHAALLGDKKNVLYPPANSGVFDPKNDHLFTAEAAPKAFEHLKDSGDEFEKLKARRDEHGIVRLTPQERPADSEELARINAPSWRRVSTKVVRTAEDAAELQRVKAQLADAAEALKAREAKQEERVANFVIWGIVLGMLVAFVAAVAAIVFMK